MKILILGAGPAGLTVANKCQSRGGDVLVLEAGNEAGGLCRSCIVDNAPLDIGGGHFLDVRNESVVDFLFSFMPKDEWNIFSRKSLIKIDGNYIAHPFEANIWQMDIDSQVEYLESIACAGANTSVEQPSKFIDWIYWKLGKKIADAYMIPYNKKMFGENLENLGTYWLSKLPSVSFRETIKSCLEHKAYGTQPGHARFYYPKTFGYGELWKRMAKKLGNRIKYNAKVCEIDFLNKIVKTAEGNTYQADLIISTIPWVEFTKLHGLPEELHVGISRLKHTSVKIEYFSDKMNTDAHWIYYPDLKLPYHRILVRHNFCLDSRGYWTETNTERETNISENSLFSYINKYAYPLNTVDKPHIMDQLLAWTSERGVIGLGRWGEHRHYNSDMTVEKALELSERIFRNEL